MLQVVARVFLLCRHWRLFGPNLGAPWLSFSRIQFWNSLWAMWSQQTKTFKRALWKKHLAKALLSGNRTNSFLSKDQHVTLVSSHIPSCFGKFVDSVNSEAEMNLLQTWHVRHMVNAYWHQDAAYPVYESFEAFCLALLQGWWRQLERNIWCTASKTWKTLED